MKKSLLTAVAVCFVAGTAVAQYQVPQKVQKADENGAPRAPVACQYTPMQDLIRNARDDKNIKQLVKDNVKMVDPTIKCGGSLLQLAIRRGNPAVLAAVLSGGSKDQLNELVVWDNPVVHAPEKVPLAMWAAYYAPSEAIFSTLINAGMNLMELDGYDNSVMWYAEQNPVLRETAAVDKVRSAVLYRSVTQRAPDNRQ